ncbi:Fe-S cluster assembly protein SufD [Pelagibius litoralis]|uniref:Fe-S cluster assembly protein SufD n=1 Tax=Pelagibius litoralis TaxID=374515 RepID=A0A967C2N6_9PROT|nr:Fe-S cluster assembly protein SufD [Pelagibius litoralis]NIA67224.1 Fe-S cluster assembly protein SufD [Pelagibius litoralis]
MTEAFNEHFGALRDQLPGQDLPWLTALRERGLQHFAESGLPTPRLETWKYTSLRPVEKVAFAAEGVPRACISIDRAPSLLPETTESHRMVFVDGHFRSDLSRLGELPKGAQLLPLTEQMSADPDWLASQLDHLNGPKVQPMLALNTAMMMNGFVLRLARGTVLHHPVEVVHLGGAGDAPLAYHPRNLVILAEGSQATLIEHFSHLGDQPYLNNTMTEVTVGDGAIFRHYKLQADALNAFNLATVKAEVGRDGLYDAFSMTTGARLSRNEVSVKLAGEGANCHLNGAYLVRGDQHCDNTTMIDHLVPNTTCREVFKGVIDERARAVFQGKLTVHRDAQHTNGHQLSKALLLSDRAEIDAKPELEIYADDVICSHGATAGDLDHDALFYLRARGIPEATARSMLIEAFLGETVDQIAAEGLCPALMSSIGHWLAGTRREF